MLTTKMAADEHVQPGAGAAAGLLGELQRHPIGRDDIVTTDGPFVFDAEDLVEIDATQRDKGGSRLRRWSRELGVEGREKGIAQIAVRGGQGRNLGRAQFVDEAVLQGPVDALAAAARLGRIAEDVLNAQAGEGAADLGGPAPIGGAAGGRRVPAMATAIEMQELAEAGARLAAAPMPAARLLPGDQAGGLQR